MDYPPFTQLWNSKYSYLVIDLSRDFESGLNTENEFDQFFFTYEMASAEVETTPENVVAESNCTWNRKSGKTTIRILFGVM